MRNKVFIFLAGVEATLFLAALYFEPGCRVRGVLWGEAFFAGKPTSYWRQELERWEISYVRVSTKNFGAGDVLQGIDADAPLRLFHRPPTKFEHWRDKWQGTSAEERLFRSGFLNFRGPEILHGSDEAKAVLRELLDNPSPKIRLFAQIGLGMDPNLDGQD